MTRTISLKLALICLGLTACAQHNPAEANCFNFRDAPARAGSSTTTVSTMERGMLVGTWSPFPKLFQGVWQCVANWLSIEVNPR